MPRLAAFPKGWIDDLVTGTMLLREWLELASKLGLDGVELYPGMIDLRDDARWSQWRPMAGDLGLELPMLCCSPDFTHPDAAFRAEQVAAEKRWIDLTVALGGTICRVLSGQRRPEVSRADGLRYAADAIGECLPYAAERGVTLVIENHYKDNYWTHPEFAQHTDVFCELVGMIDAPNFGVNYDPSNTILAGEDPIDLLDRVATRVVSMHASDRYLAHGTIEDLRREEDSLGYASRLRHGEIGAGLNDYDAIFTRLRAVGFDGWISIEDGVDGVEQMQRSIAFLRRKVAQHF